MCNTDSNVKGDLVRHTKTHDTKRSFQCDVCEKKFTRKSSLTEHTRTHTGECPFQCDECGRKFGKASNLKRHKRIHTGERPFKCDVCNMAFIYNGNLTEHEKIHTHKRSFKCTECGKCFQQKAHLNNHTLIHSTPPPTFKRDTSFYQKRSLERHVYTHSEKQPHKANGKVSKISSERCTTDRNPVRPEPDHNNEKSLESSHCDASLTSTTSNQHIKSKTHTTNSETGLTTPDDVSTITQLPSVSNQPSTSDIYINKSQNQEEYGEYSKCTETVALLNEFIDTYPITPMDPGPFEHHDHDDFFLIRKCQKQHSRTNKTLIPVI